MKKHKNNFLLTCTSVHAKNSLSSLNCFPCHLFSSIILSTLLFYSVTAVLGADSEERRRWLERRQQLMEQHQKQEDNERQQDSEDRRKWLERRQQLMGQDQRREDNERQQRSDTRAALEKKKAEMERQADL